MRNYKKNILVTAAVLLILGAITASAQMAPVYGVKMTTSFPFTVGNTMLPAGDYRIARLSNHELYSLVLQGEGRQVTINTVGASSKTPFVNKTEVVFDNIGGQYFLVEVRSAGSETGNKIVQAGTYRRLMASSRPIRRIVVSTSDTGF